MLGATTIKNIEHKLLWGRISLHVALLSAVLVLGTLLRFYDLGTESYWVDEVTMARLTSGDFDTIVQQTLRGRPPVYVVLTYGWVQLWGTSEIATRSLAALFGVAALGVMYAVGRELFGKTVGLISTFLMAISEAQIYHSQTIRYYSLFVLFGLCSFLFYIRALRTNKPSQWALYVVCSILLFYTHTYGIFLLVAQGLYAVLQWRRYWHIKTSWLISEALIGLGIASSFLSAFTKTTAGEAGVMNWIPDQPLWAPLLTMYRYVFPDRRLPSITTIGVAVAFLVLVTVIFVVRQGWPRWMGHVRQLSTRIRALSEQVNPLLLVVLWLIIPVFVPFILAQFLGPIYIDRYTIPAAPALYLLIALAITTLRYVIPQLATIGLLVVLITPGLYEYYASNVKEEWRDAAAYIEQQSVPGEAIVFAPHDRGALQRAFSWYYQGALPQCGIDATLADDAAIAEALRGCLGGAERFWLVMRGKPDRLAALRSFFLEHRQSELRLVQSKHFTDIDVYTFDVIQR